MTPRIVSAVTLVNRGRGVPLVHAVLQGGYGRIRMAYCELVRLDDLVRHREPQPVTCPRCIRALKQDGLA